MSTHEKHGEVRIDSIPTMLYKCTVCQALVGDFFLDLPNHMRWHEKRGDLDED